MGLRENSASADTSATVIGRGLCAAARAKNPSVSAAFGSGLVGNALPLAQAGNHRIRCQHSRSMQRVLGLISWFKNPRKSLIIQDLSPAWLSGWAYPCKLLI